MIKKIIVGLVVLVAVLGIGFATYSNTKNNNTTSNSTLNIVNHNTTNDTNNTNTSSSSKTKITSAEAKKIANTYINSPGATAGTPNLIKQDSKYVYIVPVIDNGTNVGEIHIDATTGANLGGAGGSPYINFLQILFFYFKKNDSE
jgi:uncharacterized membrane protein YkoI